MGQTVSSCNALATLLAPKARGRPHPIGASLVTKVRDYSYAKHALAISEQCDEATFVATFGAGRAEAASLIASKTVTLPLLLTIAPEGVTDPSPLLYDDAFNFLAGCSALACVCNVSAFRLSPRR